MAIFSVVSVQLSKNKGQVSEQQQQLLLLKASMSIRKINMPLVEEHDLLGLTHQEQRIRRNI